MKLKDLNWKYWILIYLAFMVVLGITAGLFNRVNINIHSNFIFTTVLFIHFWIILKHSETYSSRTKNFLMVFIAYFLIQSTIGEFYGTLTINLFGNEWNVINTIFAVVVVIFLIGYIKDKLNKKKENKRKLKEIVDNQPKEEINQVSPEELKKEGDNNVKR